MADDADKAADEQAQTPEEQAVAERIAALEKENQKLRDAARPKDPNAAPEPEPAKVGAVCNSCGADSRRGEADPETGEVPDRDDKTDFGFGDLLFALDHNARWGHHISVNDGENTFQYSPRSV